MRKAKRKVCCQWMREMLARGRLVKREFAAKVKAGTWPGQNYGRAVARRVRENKANSRKGAKRANR